MIDKSLVKLRFEKSLETYDENAFIQKLMAKKLVRMLGVNSVEKILEIGCSTGLLTKEIKYGVKFNGYYANDIVEKSAKYFKEIIPQGIFIKGDIENITLINSYDLIVSNAALQWCNDVESVINKLYDRLNENGILAISMFGDCNLPEIYNLFDIPNKVNKIENLKKYLSKYKNITLEEDIQKVLFDNPIDVLKHLKYTGVNAITNYSLNKSKLKMFEEKYLNLYSKDNKVGLTYNPIYIIIKKIDGI